nr:trypsin-like peptidase domain-containing protein [Deltaproteobacteria bacterium]
MVVRMVLGILIMSWLLPAAVRPEDSVHEAVVKLYCIQGASDYLLPWQMAGLTRGTGSGCIIRGKRILTNAHVVSNHAFIQVRRAGQATKYTAKVDMIAHECDLAILTVDDELFFEGVKPIDIGDLAEVRDRVAVYGFPKGGDELCITEGVISRVEHTRYSHSSASLLTCQMDAAINPGSSGGPVVKGDRIVGVAFQGGGGENIGYMVPSPVIKHLLTDIADGRHDGTPDLQISVQAMENPALRKQYRLADGQTGVRISRILMDSPVINLLKVNDVILSIGGIDVADDGTIMLRPGERTSWQYIVQQKQLGDTVAMNILRDGQPLTVNATLSIPINYGRLVPYEQYDVLPSYYIIGGLVFEPLTVNYLQRWGKAWYSRLPIELTNYYVNGEPASNRRQVIVLIRVLADELNAGYQGLEHAIIVSVNGRKISAMKDLVAAFEEHQGDTHTIIDEKNRIIILERANLAENSQRILQKYKIASDRSADLR